MAFWEEGAAIDLGSEGIEGEKEKEREREREGGREGERERERERGSCVYRKVSEKDSDTIGKLALAIVIYIYCI